MKSSFILHIDSLCILDKLTDEQAGQFIKAIYQYQKTKELPETDALIALVLAPFLNQFLRDEMKYEAVAQRNRENGANGGRPPKNQGHKPRKPSGFKITQNNPENPEEPRKPDSDSDNDSDSEKDILIPFENFYEAYGFKRDRQDAVKAWNKLSSKDRQKAIDYIPTYYKLKKEWQETRYPATYLNKRTWEDEAGESSPTHTLKIIKAVEIDSEGYVHYESGPNIPAPWNDYQEYLQGKKQLAHFDRKVS
jgi:hypothetical protein